MWAGPHWDTGSQGDDVGHGVDDAEGASLAVLLATLKTLEGASDPDGDQDEVPDVE